MNEFILKAGFKNIVIGGIVAISVCVASFLATAETFSGLKPAEPQPNAAELKPGLAVQYYGAKFNDIAELDDWMKYDDGKAGTPIPMLNYQVGTGNVLTATSEDFVGADIKGFINMAKPGRYTFMVHSNDGVYLAIGDKLIYEFPTVHADTFSDEIVVEISEPGWYPIHIKYFEKKNTSTLELYWEAPNGGDMDYVPANVFAHIGK
jgi:PA14 domain